MKGLAIEDEIVAHVVVQGLRGFLLRLNLNMDSLLLIQLSSFFLGAHIVIRIYNIYYLLQSQAGTLSESGSRRERGSKKVE